MSQKFPEIGFLYFLEDNSALVWSVELQAADLKEILFR